MAELQNAIKKLHQIGPQTIAVSSTDFNDKLTALVSTVKGWLCILQNIYHWFSRIIIQIYTTNVLFSDNALIKIDIPKIPATFTGSGDLFAALFLAHLHLQNDIKTIMEKTINSLYSVLLNTYEYYKGK